MKSENNRPAVFAQFINNELPNSSFIWLTNLASIQEIARLTADANASFAKQFIARSSKGDFSSLERSVCLASWRAALAVLSAACPHELFVDGCCNTCLARQETVSEKKYGQRVLVNVRDDYKYYLNGRSMSKRNKDSMLNRFTVMFNTFLLEEVP